MESKALEESTINIVPSRVFARTPRIRWIINICYVVDRFLRKTFRFFLSIFSIFSSMRLCSRALWILAAMDLRVTLGSSWQLRSHSLKGKGVCIPFIHQSIAFWWYTALQCRIRMSNSLVFHTSGGISSAVFLFLYFSLYWVMFYLRYLS